MLYNFGIVLKILAMLVLLVPVAKKNVPLERNQQQQQPQDHADAPQPIAPPLAVSEVDKENAANAERYAYYKAHPKEYLKVAVAPANASNWVLAVLGVIGGFLAWRTVGLLKRQTNHITTSERAWMIVDLGQPIFFRPPRSAVIINPQIRNKGKTPAFIVESASAAIVLKKDESLPEKPPPYPDVAKWDGRGIPLAPEGTIGGHAIARFEDMQQIIDGSMVLWVFGYVKYNDVFGRKIRETKYCVRWEPELRNLKVPQYSLDGPEGYNEAT